MARSLNKLTAVAVKNAKPGILRDGGGLALRVEDSGKGRWFIRISVDGKRRDIGLGSSSEISLGDARKKAAEVREKVQRGEDPAPTKPVVPKGPLNFQEAAEEVMALRLPGLRNDKNKAQWKSTFESYVYPVFGARHVAEVDSGDVLKALSKIWLSTPATAQRVRQRIRVVLDWSVAAGHRSADRANAAVAALPGLPKQPRSDSHHPALDWREMPGFIVKLRASPATPSVRLGLEFLILTASRTNEVMGARWEEIDFKGKVWNIPASRMKAKRPHRVPLSVPALAVLAVAKQMWGAKSEFIFPGVRRDETLSSASFLMTMRRLTDGEATTHGFRSSFMDWALDRGFAQEIADACLAHTPSKIIAAYRRTDLLEQRRNLMDQWARFCEGEALEPKRARVKTNSELQT